MAQEPKPAGYFDVHRALEAGMSKEDVESFMINNNLLPKPEAPSELPSTSLATSLATSGNTSSIPSSISSPTSLTPAGISIPGDSSLRSRGGMDILRDLSPILSGIGGAAAGGASSLIPGAGTFTSGLAASGGSALIDEILGKFLFNQEPSASHFAGNVALNEIGGRVLGRLGSAAKNIAKEADVSAAKGAADKFNIFNPLTYAEPALNYMQAGLANLRDQIIQKFAPSVAPSVGKGSVTGALAEFDPTFSQMLETQGSGIHPIVSTIEDVFARKSKLEALDNSMKKIVSKAETQATSAAGSKIPISLTGGPNTKTLDSLADTMRLKTQVNYENLVTEINDISSQIKPFQEQIRALETKLATATKGSPEETAIKASIDSVKNDPNLLKLQSNAKALQGAYSSFIFPGEKGYSVKDFLMKDYRTGRITVDPTTGRDVVYAKPVAETLLDDDKKLQRFFNTGEITIGKTSITSASPRKDAAGYQFGRMLNDSYDAATDKLDVAKLQNVWNDYKTSNMGRIIYNGATRSNYDQLFETLSHITPSMQTGPSRYLTLRLGIGSAYIGSGLLTTALTGSTPAGLTVQAAVLGGAIGLNQLGKLMANPDVARLMIAAIKGGPLNTSNAIASRMIFRALRGQTMTLETKDENGNTIQTLGRINAEGKFEQKKGD